MAEATGRDTTSLPAHQGRSASENEAERAIRPSHGIEIKLPPNMEEHRPHPVKHMSAPAYQSPIRHRKRTPSQSRHVRETINAHSQHGGHDDDDASAHRINQYVIKQEIGRGSFGAVHLAVDQYGNEFAVKEFSKSRLRKRAQSNLLRKPNQRHRSGHFAAGLGFNSPLHRHSSSSENLGMDDSSKPFELIKEEIAIMKKLNHPNLVSLIEVLDDPEEDSLYMVLEMCKKGVVMKVGLEDRAEPYSDEACRCWFRDMILGIEYLHEQGIIHRDIKPDNCLITADDVLKIVDFGVSEMFESPSPMATAKSAGSPAFMPPELCVAKHGHVSGRAADIWSMGVTLYCLRYGRIPYEKTGMLELYQSIREDALSLDGETNKDFADLIRRLLAKDPEERISMEQLREHTWVTRNGTDPLLSAEENCADLVEPPTEAEMNRAITGNMGNLMVVVKAVRRFKNLITRKRPFLMDSILGRDSRMVTPPHSLYAPRDVSSSRSVDAHDRRPVDQALAIEGVHRGIEIGDDLQKLPADMNHVSVLASSSAKPQARHGDAIKQTQGDQPRAVNARPSDKPSEHRHSTHPDRSQTFPQDDHAKGHAHNPLDDTLFLSIGAGLDEGSKQDVSDELHPIVSESPPAIEMNIYEQAYQDEMNRILADRGDSASMFLTRRVEHREDLRSHSNIIDRSREAAASGARKLGESTGLSSIVRHMKEQQHSKDGEKSEHVDATSEGSQTL